MAAIQTIRNHGKLIVGALGLALFSFIAGDLFQAIEGLVIGNKQQAGEVSGTSLDINEYNQLVDERTQVEKLMLRIQGLSDNLTNAQIQQIRDEVWQDFVRTQIIAEQADEAGIQVTDKDVENALVKGEHSSLQWLVPFFGTPEGKLNFTALQEFLNTKEQTLAQAQQAQNQELVEQVDMIYTLWKFTEKQLRKGLLEDKFYALVQSACFASPFIAQLDSLDYVQKRAIVAAYPYNAIQDADVTVSDADLQAAYEANKELFKNYAPSRTVKMIDVEVTADSVDYNTLLAEVEQVSEALRAGNDPAAVVAASKSTVSYNTLHVRKNAFLKKMPEIYSSLGTDTVGYVSAPFYSVKDTTINTFKIVSKVNAPDSVLFRRVMAVASDINASKVLADSIADAVKGGASFAELAKKYQQPSDSMWMVTADYENRSVDAYSAEMINLVNNTKPGEVAVLKADNNFSMVIEVLDAKHFIDKYNVAVVKCKNEFSKRTYNAALSKLNKFLSENKTIEDIEKNALASNYTPRDFELSGAAISLESKFLGVKEAIRWALDDAEVGAVSRIYECGAQKEHLIVFAVTEAHDDEYRAWNSKRTKEKLEAMVKQEKKAAKALELVGTPKTIDEVAKVANIVVDSTITVSFAENVSVTGINVPETVLSGAVANTKAGGFVGPIKGEGAVYFVQVVEEVPSDVPYNKDNALQMATYKYMNNIISWRVDMSGRSVPIENLVYVLIQDAKVVDNRYKF